MIATHYDEIVVKRLYDGKTQLDQSLQQLLQDGETVLDLNPGWRQRTIIRVDGRGGSIKDINRLLQRRYQILVKVKHWR